MRPLPACWQPAADLAATVRALAPLSDDMDGRFERGEPNDAAVVALAEASLLGLTPPACYGGLGRDYTVLAVVCEELGAIDTAHQVSLTVHLHPPMGERRTARPLAPPAGRDGRP